MYYVYILQSISFPDNYYIGYTQDLKTRLDQHNNGKTDHTLQLKPWKIVSYHAFANETKAKNFESYLKTGSGRAFSKKHF